MQAPPSVRPSKKQLIPLDKIKGRRKPLADFKSKMKRANGGLLKKDKAKLSKKDKAKLAALKTYRRIAPAGSVAESVYTKITGKRIPSASDVFGKQYNIKGKPIGKNKMKRAEGGFTDNRKKIGKAPPFGVINADDFKALKAMKKKSNGGSIMVPVKMGKNKITKIM